MERRGKALAVLVRFFEKHGYGTGGEQEQKAKMERLHSSVNKYCSEVEKLINGIHKISPFDNLRNKEKQSAKKKSYLSDTFNSKISRFISELNKTKETSKITQTKKTKSRGKKERASTAKRPRLFVN